MATPQTSDMRDVCRFCTQMLCMDRKGDNIVIQHHRTVADFIQQASECILCGFIEQCWEIERAHARFPDLSESYYGSMPLEITLSKPEVLDTYVSWSLVQVLLRLPKYGMAFMSEISVASCRAEITKSTFWTGVTPSIPSRLTSLSTWFNECESTHVACAPIVSIMPKRLITTGLLDEVIRIVHTVDLKLTSARYATLSYCWGDKLPLRTTSSNQAMLENGISAEVLPKTFRDAIELARGLDVPYLWIDALCIRQDDPVEWAQEAAIMKDVYAGCVLTIAASNSTCSDDGCFTSMAPSHPYSRNIQFSMRHADGNPLHVRARDGDARSLANETSLSFRGWVLQEEILSRRVVYCMLPEMHWRCQCLYQTESGTVFDKRKIGALPLLNEQPKSDLHDIWYQWMKNYSDRQFTFERDRLSAMAGIVEHFASISGDRHVLGCWEASFAQGLMWLPLSRQPPRSGILGIPSWSWLTRYDDVSYDIWTRPFKDATRHFQVELLDWDVSWTGIPLVSDITAAQVRVRGPVQEIVLSVAPEARDFNPPYLNVGEELPDFTKNPIPWRCAGRIDPDNDTKQSFTCLLLWSITTEREKYHPEIVLLLKPVTSNDSTVPKYRRVGLAKFHGEQFQFADKIYQDIILV